MRCGVLFLALACGFLASEVARADQDGVDLEEARESGGLDALEEGAGAGIPDSLVGHSTSESPHKEEEGPAGRRPIRRLSLRWTSPGVQTGQRLRGSWSGEPFPGRIPLSMRGIIQVSPETEAVSWRGALGLGGFEGGHIEIRWGEGVLLATGERDPGWGGGPPAAQPALKTKPWPWIGPVDPPVTILGRFRGLGGPGISGGALAIRTPDSLEKGAKPDAYGAWVARGSSGSGSDPRSWIGLMLLGVEDGAKPDYHASASGAWVAGRTRLGFEWVVPQLDDEMAFSVRWQGRRSAAPLADASLRVRWDRGREWIWSGDPRRPPSGRTRWARVYTTWHLGGRARLLLQGGSEDRSTASRPIPAGRRELRADLLLQAPMQPRVTWTVRGTREVSSATGRPAWRDETLSRWTVSLRPLDGKMQVGLRAGLASFGRPAPDGAGRSGFVESHGTSRRGPITWRWSLGGSGGASSTGPWIALFPDPSGWVPLPVTPAGLWLGGGLGGRGGPLDWGIGSRATVRGGELRVALSVQLGWRD